MNIPEFIKPGDTIGITAPSFGCTTEPYISRFNEACKKFIDRGYKLKIGKSVHMSDGIGISSTPEYCAKELEEFYCDPEIKAVISAGGGELMCETASKINFDKIKSSSPKWFIGYSDNTNFIFPNIILNDICGIYAGCISGFGKPWENAEFDAIELLEGTKKTFSGYEKFQLPEDGTEAKENNPISSYVLTQEKKLSLFNCKNNKAELNGILLGGCLDVLANLTGTKLDKVKDYVKNKNIIWALESCDANLFEYRRQIHHLKECGWFDTATGFLIGRPLASFNMDFGNLNKYNCVSDILKDYNVPIIFDCDFGHISPSIPLVIGAECSVRIDKNDLQIKFNI